MALHNDLQNRDMSLRELQNMMDEHMKACMYTYSCLSHHIDGLANGTQAQTSTCDLPAAFELNRCRGIKTRDSTGGSALGTLHPAEFSDALLEHDGPVGEGLHHVAASQSTIAGSVIPGRSTQRQQRASASLPTASIQAEPVLHRNSSAGRLSHDAARDSITGGEEGRDGGPNERGAGQLSVRNQFSKSFIGAVKENIMNDTPYAPRKSFGATRHGTTFRKMFVDVLPPDHHYIALFKALLLFICMATALAVPFDVSFHTLLDNSLPFIHSTMAAVEIVFLMDIYNNFRTGYYSATRGSFVFNRRLIASRYARSHLMTDVLAALPVTLAWLAPHWALGSHGSGVSMHPAETSDVVNVYSLLQLLKIFKIAKLAQLTAPLEVFFSSAQVAVARLIFTFIAIFHGTACGFHLMSFLLPTQDSWIETQGLDDALVLHRYIASLYWTFTTISTTGYGDIVPKNIAERVYSMAAMLLGLTVFSYFISSVSQAVEMMNAASMRSKEQRRTIDMFAQMHKLPRSMHHRVRTYYDYLLRNGVHDLNSHVVTSLSPQLRQDVLLFLYSDLVAKVPFFKNKSTHFIAELIQKLDAEVFPPGEYVTIEGQLGYTMFFVRTGRLEVRVAHNLQRYLAALATMQSARGARLAAPALSQTDEDDPDSWVSWVATAIRRLRSAKVAPAHGTASRAGLWYDQAEAELQRYDVVRALDTGEYFGELACLTGVRRTATVIAVQYSETMSLSKDALDATVSEFPAYKFSMTTEVEGYHTLVQELIGRTPNAGAGADGLPWGLPDGHGVGGQVASRHGSMTDAVESVLMQAAAREPSGEMAPREEPRGRERSLDADKGVASRRSRSAPSGLDRGEAGGGSSSPRPEDAQQAAGDAATSTSGVGGAVWRTSTAATAARTGLLERMRLLDVAVEADPEQEGVPSPGCEQEGSSALNPAQHAQSAGGPQQPEGLPEGVYPLADTVLLQERDRRLRQTSTVASGTESGARTDSRELDEVLEAGVVRVQQLAGQLQQQMAGRAAPGGHMLPSLGGSRLPPWANSPAMGVSLSASSGGTMRPLRNELRTFMRQVSGGSSQSRGRSTLGTSIDWPRKAHHSNEDSAI